MIIIDLLCEQEHRFEGWFASAEDFERQNAQGLVQCPVCDSSGVRRVPSASYIATGAAAVAPSQPKAAAPAPSMPDPAQLLQQLGEVLMAHSEDVGAQFAEEARRIHYEEAPARPIRGQASQDECDALEDEGISVLRIPVKKPETLN